MHSSSLQPAALALALLAGCSSEPEVPQPDATPPPPPEEVHGVAQVTHETGGARATRPVDWSGTALSAYTVAPSGELVVYPATTRPDGSFEIPGIPPGSDYYLRIQRPGEPGEIYRLSQRSIDLGLESAVRPELGVPAPMGSQLSLTLENMPALELGDSFRAYAPGVVEMKYLPFLTNWPVEGDTRLSDATFPWDDRPQLRGESLWVIQERSTPGPFDGMGFGFYTAAAAHLPSVQYAGGTKLSLSGAFSPTAPIAMSYTLDFAALRRRPGPSAGDGLGLVVTASPVATNGDYPVGGGTSVLDWIYAARTLRARHTHDFTYADPFPVGWSRTATATYYRISKGYAIDIQQGAFYANDVLEVTERSNAPFAAMPALNAAEATWVQDITIDGEPLDRVRIPNGRPVRLAWRPVPGAAHYRITVLSYPAESLIQTEQRIATLASAKAELVLPADFLPAEARLAFTVAAIPDGSFESAPRLVRKPRGPLTSATSDVLYTSSTCGNGALDPGESCDTGGPSESCDFDCTPAQCGDGVHNAAAGEACDVGTWDEVTCDNQCQPIQCGDGVTSGAEQCDDGNTAPGDGCSAECAAEQ